MQFCLLPPWILLEDEGCLEIQSGWQPGTISVNLLSRPLLTKWINKLTFCPVLSVEATLRKTESNQVVSAKAEPIIILSLGNTRKESFDLFPECWGYLTAQFLLVKQVNWIISTLSLRIYSPSDKKNVPVISSCSYISSADTFYVPR